jgi:hypothetical protein
LSRTLAPFVNSEKPQVFPWAAASFINKVPQISELSLIGTDYCTARNNLRQTSERQMCLYLLGIFNCPARQEQQIHVQKPDVRGSLTATKQHRSHSRQV